MKEPPVGLLIRAITPRFFPTDLAFVLFWTLATLVAMYLPGILSSPLRTFMALPMVLFIPGYSLVSAFFPSSREADGIKRIALSLGVSIVIVPLIGLGLNFTPFGIRLDPMVACLAIIVVTTVFIARFRREQIPADERFTVRCSDLFNSITEWLFPRSSTRNDRILSTVLVISIIAAAVTTVYVVVVPKEGDRYTEFYILGKNHMAAEYPARFTSGMPGNITVGIGNHEFSSLAYTVELFAVNETQYPDGKTREIDRMERIGRYEREVPHNTTREDIVSFTVSDPGFNRIFFLLYKGSPPEDRITGMDRVNASYRDLHIRISPTGSGV